MQIKKKQNLNVSYANLYSNNHLDNYSIKQRLF